MSVKVHYQDHKVLRILDFCYPTIIKKSYLLDLFAALSIKSGKKTVSTLEKYDFSEY